MENSNDRNLVVLKREFTSHPGEKHHNLEIEIVINVIYTDLRGTLAALQAAETLARQLRAKINLIAAHSVPYGLPINYPPVSLKFLEYRLTKLAKRGQLHTAIEIYVCRDRTSCFMQALSSKSLVVLGIRKRWWPTKEIKLARRLQSAGHRIVVVEPAQDGI